MTTTAPPALVVGSPVARALFEVWSGHRTAEVLAADPQTRADVATALAKHLLRSDITITIAARKRDGLERVVNDTWQEPGAISGGLDFIPGPATVASRDRLVIVLASYETPEVTALVWSKARVVFVGPSPVAPKSWPDPLLALGPVPLDIQIAGAR